MSLTEQIYAQALSLAGEGLDTEQKNLLHALCAAEDAAMEAGGNEKWNSPEGRRARILAGGLYAMADFMETDEARSVQRFTAGTVTVQRAEGTGGAGLRQQADRILTPFRGDRFAFRGV